MNKITMDLPISWLWWNFWTLVSFLEISEKPPIYPGHNNSDFVIDKCLLFTCGGSTCPDFVIDKCLLFTSGDSTCPHTNFVADNWLLFTCGGSTCPHTRCPLCRHTRRQCLRNGVVRIENARKAVKSRYLTLNNLVISFPLYSIFNSYCFQSQTGYI